MGNRKALDVARAAQPHLHHPEVETITLTEVAAEPGVYRQAVIYPIADTIGTACVKYRLRLERYPEHLNAGAHGWTGGRVVWNADSTDRDEVEAQGREFVEFGWHQ